MLFILRNVFFLLLFLALVGCAGQDKAVLERNGAARNYYPDSTLEIEVVYKNGVRTSIRHFYPSGKLHTEVDSAGNYRQYFENGTLAMEFTEKEGKKIGDEKIYFSNGKPKSILKYKDGVCYHRDDYHNNGSIASACKIVRSPERREICQTFYKSGKPKTVTDDDGHYTDYYENGKVKRDFVYRGDTLVEEREYYETGTPKELTRYNGVRIKGCVGRCNWSENISYYANGKIQDSCYMDKPLDWDGKSGRGIVRVCKKFYENGNLSEEPVYRNAKLVEKKKYYSSGMLKEHEFFGEKGLVEKKEYYPSGTLYKYVVYEDGRSYKQFSQVSYYKNGLVRDSCFNVDSSYKKSFGGNVCNYFSHEGIPRELYIEKEGSLLKQTFHDDGKLESSDVYGAVGKLAYTRYFEDGSVRDSCFLLRRGGEYRDVCKKYGKGRSLSLLQILKGDTIYEKRYLEEKLMSECAIVWNGSHDEESDCKSYNRDGSLRDSTINKIKKDFIFRQYFRCDEKGKYVRAFEEKHFIKEDGRYGDGYSASYYMNGFLRDSSYTFYQGNDRHRINKNYTENGILKDSVAFVEKNDCDVGKYFYCDNDGKFIRYKEEESCGENSRVRTIKRKSCRVDKGKLVDCQEEQLQGAENEEL